MAKAKNKILIIDGNALIHRSFHAIPPTMATKSGEIVNAVYGFTSVLLKAIKEFKPKYVVLTLDRKAPTFRHKMFKEYKAKRVKAPDELYAQIPRVKEIADIFHIPVFEKNGYEADDLIGTIAKKVDENGKAENIIVTGDADTMQLINKNTRVYTMSRGFSDHVLYDEKGVLAKYSLSAEQMIDYKALRGDPSDNIPGVRGIGEKTAVELLRDFKTLDGVYENINSKKIRDRIRELLIQYKKDAYLSRDLATINRETEIDFDLEKAEFGKYDLNEVASLFSELEFKSLLPRVKDLLSQNSGQRGAERGQTVSDKFERNKKLFKYHIVKTEKEFQNFLIKLKKQKMFTLDTETMGVDVLNDSLRGISFSWQEGEAYFLPIINADKTSPHQKTDLFNYKSKREDGKKIHPYLKSLEQIFIDEKIKKSGHNIKFDARVIENAAGKKLRGIAFDTMIASYLLNPGTRQNNLDNLVFSELGFEKISKEDLLGKGKEKITFADVPEEKLGIYSCEDADFSHRLIKKLEKELIEKELIKLFSEIEIPLIPVLAEMENNGIKIDEKFLKSMSVRLAKDIGMLEKKIYKLAGSKFNIRSTKQLQEKLFRDMNIAVEFIDESGQRVNIKKNKTGLSTSFDELEKLKGEHEIIHFIQEFRELSKLVSTYVDALPQLVNKKTSRVHTSFNQTITSTGRLSSTEPNLQNIPARTELGREIRKAFVAPLGRKFISADYSQIELRLAAHLSGDERMIKAFHDGVDIHSSTAAEIRGIKLEDVTKEMRREAKATNFGILYGQGPYGLSRSADIPFARAREFIDQYFSIFKGVRKYLDKTMEKARAKGYVETLFSRRRYLPDLNSSMPMARKAAERMAVNAPIQGTAADIMKIAMINIDKIIEEKFDEKVKMLLQVHDELIFEVEDGMVEEASKIIKREMENVIKLSVPIEVDVKIGNNWGEMKKYDRKN
ncbi:MAG: DNA polymerase I [bacterium]